VAVVLLGFGGVVAWQVNAALGLAVRAADVPVETVTAAPRQEVVPAPEITSIVVPDDPRLRLAADAVAAAVVSRDAARPEVRTEAGQPTDTALRVQLDSGLDGEAYRLDGLTLTAGTANGAAAGLYAVADRIRSGTAVTADGTVTAPRLGLRLTDLGAVGLPDDPAAFAGGADYSLNSDVVGAAILPGAPYVDTAEVATIAGQFQRQIEHSLAQGYNGVVIPGFLEYVTFDGLGVYPAGDPHRARAQAMVAAFGPVWRRAHDLGMTVFLSTDMLALSPPLRAYLDRTVGGLHTEDDRLWQVYRTGLAELFTALPFVDGLMIRIGEGGAAYQLPGWDYSSEIAVTTPEAVRAMLRAFLRVAGDTGRDIIFRTWSVGIGAVGDLHTSQAAYRQVLGGLDKDLTRHLVVSTKYTLGDFYSHLPLNDTLLAGAERRIVEFQSRREFEGAGSLPNDLGVLHQVALRRFLAANPHVEGVWTWTQGGGPLLAGPRTLALRSGFWQLYDLNTYVTARLAWDPDQDPARATADWVRATFSLDPDTVAALCEALALSRDAVTTGLYLGPYADKSVHALGLAPPPMMWIFEWDIVTGDSAALSTVYAVSRDHVDDAVAEGTAAVADARRMRDLVTSTDPAGWRDPVLRRQFVDTLDYQLNLFETLGAYRTTVLRHAQWLDTGSATAHEEWLAAAGDYESARTEHVRRYGGDLDLPAYNFTAADIGLALAYRDETMAWLARGLLVAVLAVLALGWARGRRLVPRAPVAFLALWTAATRPWRLGRLAVEPTRVDRVLVWAVPAAAVVLSRAVLTSFAAPAHLVPTLGAWLLFCVVLRLSLRRTDPFPLLAAIGGLALLRTVLLLLALVLRGPGHYWFEFWTDPAARSVYVAVAFAAFLAVFVVVYVVLRGGYGRTRGQAAGHVVIAAGVPLAAVGGLAAVLGLERALTWWNDQLALLPWGLSRILGITGHLGIPTSLASAVAVTGCGAIALGAVLSGASRLRRRRHAEV
jgi:hypothetical protein